MDKKELFLCCKTGNLSRLKYLVEEKDVDLDTRDKWDCTPLYYACLCGHYEVVHFLLESGVHCDANTFDGERCLYGALTDEIRRLLQNFKVITSITMRRDKYSEFLRRTFESPDYSDIEFLIENEKILAHRSILTARSVYFQHLFNTSWKDIMCIDLTHLNTAPGIFKNLLQFLYMGQVKVNKKELESFISIAKYFSLHNLVAEIQRILLSTKKNISVLYIQPSPLPQQDYLKLFSSSLPKDFRSEEEFEELQFIDLHIKIDSYVFLCHKVFICGRCSYLKALVTDHFSETSVCDDSEIQVITLHGVDPQVFVRILQYIYTDTADLLPENVLDVLCYADIFILPGLKKLCSAVVQENLTIDNVIAVIKVARLYDLPRLETECTEFMADHLEEIVNQADFKSLILEDANEIKNRQETDTISVIDDIRYHIANSAQISDSFSKHLLIDKLLENLKLEA